MKYVIKVSDPSNVFYFDQQNGFTEDVLLSGKFDLSRAIKLKERYGFKSYIVEVIERNQAIVESIMKS